MKSALIPLLFYSEKRTDLLLLLKKGPRVIDEINQELDTDLVTILPQIKKLKDKNLVVQEKKTYNLSSIGKVLVQKMSPIVTVFKLLENDYYNWPKRDLAKIPPHLLKRIDELGECIPLQPQEDGASPLYDDVIEAFSTSPKILMLVTYFHPNLPGFCIKHAMRGAEVSLVFTLSVFEKFKEVARTELDTLIRLENSALYLLKEDLDMATIAVASTLIQASFPREYGFSSQRDMVGFGEEAISWGEELFMHYRNLAKTLTPDLETL